MGITEIKEKITPVLLEYGVKKTSVFGSVSRGEDHPDSDVDILIELGDTSMGMFRYMRFIGEMESRLFCQW
jgi:predicted nucleotidyltransferase